VGPDASNALGGKLHLLGLGFNRDPIYRHLTPLWSYVDASDGQATEQPEQLSSAPVVSAA
jgi:hypothetical protein